MKKYFYEIAVTEPTEPIATPDVTPGIEPSGTPVESSEPSGTVPTAPTDIEIDGEKYTPEQIREWKQGHLRQSDYTKKTQELAKQRAEHSQALEVFDFLKQNPELLKQLAEYNPAVAQKASGESEVILSLQTQLKAMEIDMELNKIKAQDPDVDDVELFNIATERGIPVSEAYEYYKGKNLDKYLKRESAKLTEQIKKNAQASTTFITPKVQVPVGNYNLSQAEMSMADKLGMTYEEYSKWK
jgi:hypothetical protein